MNIYNKIKNYLKNLFKINEPVQNVEKTEEIIPEIEDSCFYIESEKVLEGINVGDIIWAKRYNSEGEMNLIPDGHREGPFVVMGINKDGLICSKGTSTTPNEENKEKYFELYNRNHELNKSTYFKLNDLVIINESTFIKKLDQLTQEEKNKFFRKYKLNNRFYYNINNNKTDFELYMQIGDIFLVHNTKYIVLDIDGDKLTVLPIEKDKYIRNISDVKELDYNKIKEIKCSNYYIILSCLTDQTLSFALKRLKEHLEFNENEKITQRGSVIEKDNKYYYVYGEEGNNWLVFQIEEEKDSLLDEIIISNRNFYTNYEDKIINKNDKINTIILCNLNEIEAVKSSRKKYKEIIKQQEEYKATEYLRLKVGDIIDNIAYKNSRYIIISIHPKTYGCLSISQIQKGIYHPVLINKQNVRLSKNKNLDNIKWLEENKNFNLENIDKEEIIDKIFDRQIEAIKSKKNKETIIKEQKNIKIERGSIISENNKYYYVYGEEGNDWLIFEICENEFPNSKPIKLNNSVFYTSYKDTKINKNSSFKFIYLATEAEKDDIKSLRKKYKKEASINIQEPTVIENKIKVGSVVKHKENETEYIVKNLMGNMLGCISRFDSESFNPHITYINKKDVVLISSNKKRK